MTFASLLLFSCLWLERLTACTSSGEDHHVSEILDVILGWRGEFASKSRPFVTVSFAQSLDGKIAVYTDGHRNATSSNYPLSGQESLILTHAVRSLHDGILIGGRTLSTDNPRLSNRYWSTGPENLLQQPRPIVLDTNLEHLEAVAMREGIHAENLVVCCSTSALDAHAAETNENLSMRYPGVSFLPCRLDSSGKLDLNDVLYRLRDTFCIESIMVEGGARVLTTFIGACLVDCLCITVAPTFLGSQGLPAVTTGSGLKFPKFKDTKATTLGDDCIFLARCRADIS